MFADHWCAVVLTALCHAFSFLSEMSSDLLLSPPFEVLSATCSLFRDVARDHVFSVGHA